MRLRLDTVQGSELDSEIYAGRITRMALITDIGVPLTQNDPLAATILIQALAIQGMPQKGDPYPHPQYQQYFCKRHILRGLQTSQVMVSIIYEYRGILTVRDHATLTNTPTQLSRKDFKPFYVTFQPPQGRPINKILTINSVLPLRHLSVSQTIPYKASTTVLNAFGAVNSKPWQGLPVGYWLFSDINGETVDNGITYTYSVTLSTKQWEDWSTIGFLTDDNGQPVPIASTVGVAQILVSVLRKRPYKFGQDNSVNGVNKIGNYPTVDFKQIFGF